MVICNWIVFNNTCLYWWLYIYKNQRGDEPEGVFAFIIVLLSGIGYTMFTQSFIYNDPKPIDVYRGKTELEITYTIKSTDTISCDTLVVWKK